MGPVCGYVFCQLGAARSLREICNGLLVAPSEGAIVAAAEEAMAPLVDGREAPARAGNLSVR